MKKLFAFLFVTLASIAFFASCEKDPVPDPPKQTPSNTEFPSSKPECEAFTKEFVDGGFENCWYWQSTQNDTYLEYQSSVLLTLNMLHALEDMIPGTTAPFTAYCDSVTPHTGKFAMKLVSGHIHDNQNGELFLPGAMAPLNEGFIDEFLNDGNISVKRPYTEKPTAIKGYYKYLPVNGDASSISVKLYNGDEVIAEGTLTESSAVGEWTAFNIPITGENYANQTPTHISVIFSASADYNFADLLSCTGQVGSALWLDDLEFVFSDR